MQIDDLTAGLSLSFLINLNTEQLQFESKILEVYPRRHTLLAQGVFTDDKIISFRGKGLVVDLIVTFPEEKPQLFKNVTTNVVKRADGTLCYTVFSVAGSKTYNRRQSYRCYVGIETAVQCGPKPCRPRCHHQGHQLQRLFRGQQRRFKTGGQSDRPCRLE